MLASASPEMIPLSGGFPNPQMFPFKQLKLEVTYSVQANMIKDKQYSSKCSTSLGSFRRPSLPSKIVLYFMIQVS